MAKNTNNSTDEILSMFFTGFRNLKHQLDLGSPLMQLNLAQTETLRLVQEHGQIAMKQVADFLEITPPSATSMIDNLVKLGYLRRRQDSRDRRAVNLTLTKSGHKMLQQGIKQRCKIFAALLKRLSRQEQLAFIKILKRMTSQN